MPLLRVKKGTFAKARPVQSGLLDETEREWVNEGKQFAVAAVAMQLERNHLKVTMGMDDDGSQITFDGRNTVYFYSEHVAIVPFNSNLLTVSETGINLIKSFEGLELTAYPDPGSGDEPWTIGYGTTGPNIRPGMTITEAEAEAFLKEDLKTFERQVALLIKVPLTQNQFDALVSLAYNIGIGALESSTLLKRVNQAEFLKAAQEFPRWCKSGDREMLGLKRRRLAEQALFTR